MKWKMFLKYLAILSLGLSIWSFGISGWGKNTNTVWIYAIAIFSFVLISLFIFMYAYNTSVTDHLFSFNNVVAASFLLKLVLSIGVLMLYERIFHPANKIHILHFIIVYIVFMVYEVYFLTKLARSSE